MILRKSMGETVNRITDILISQKKYLVLIALAMGVMVLLIGLLTRLNIYAVVGLAVFLLAGLTLISKPDRATTIVLFLIYTNIAVLAYQFYKVPKILAGSVTLLILLPFGVYVFIRRERIKIDYVLLLMILFLAASLLSYFPAIDKQITLGWIVEFLIEGLLMYFLILNVIRKPEVLRKVVWTLMLAGTLLGGLTLYQDVTKTYNNQYWGLAQRNIMYGFDEALAKGDTGPVKKAKVQRAQRADGHVGDPNRYAQILMVLLPLAYFRFFDEKKLHLKLFAVLCALLILSGILLTYSRGAFLAICLLMFLLTLMRYIRPYQIVLSFLGLLLLIFIASPGYFTRMETMSGIQGLFSSKKAAESDAVILGRTTEMLAAVMVFLDHPIVGVGLGQYMKFYALDYMDDPDIAFRKIDSGRRAHSLYLELAAETGILGLGTFMIIVFYILSQLWKARRRWQEYNRTYANYATAFLLSIIGYLSTAVFLSLAYQRFYWVLIALAGSALQILKSEDPEQSGKSMNDGEEKMENFAEIPVVETKLKRF